jgi:S-adenosylmethionine/arginine decarboxylase-like enzyme
MKKYKPKPYKGYDISIDLQSKSPSINDRRIVTNTLYDLALALGMHPLAAVWVYKFANGGLTALLPVEESHIAYHAWTLEEGGYVHLVISTCGKKPNIEDIAESLKDLEIDRLEFKVTTWGK